MIEELKNKVRELLRNKQVDLVIGYQRASDGVLAMPCFIDKEEDADILIWDSYCVYNLANYLKDFSGKKIGILAKACDVQSIVVLLQENQLKREDLYIIGVECFGVVEANKCKSCKTSLPSIYDHILKESKKRTSLLSEQDEYGAVAKMEAKSLEERLKFWKNEFSRCIRCYACRQVCPMCYCPKCVADQTMPAWFSKGANLKGNFSWNLIRALHLAGRCIDCGECERACPVGIPLRDLNKKIEKDVKELFNYEAGTSIEKKPLLASFDKNDPDNFIV